MTTITRERLLKIQQWRETFGPGSNVVLPAEEAEELARIALASLDAGSDSNNHPAHGPLSDYRLHRIREILGKAAAQSDGGNIGYAMSDAVKAIDELLAGRKVEPVAFINGAWTLVYYRPPKEAGLKVGDKLYTSPPAPVVPDELPDDCGFKDSYIDGWNAFRAAMLNRSGDVTEVEAIKQQSSIHISNGAMSGDAVKQCSTEVNRERYSTDSQSPARNGLHAKFYRSRIAKGGY